MFFCFLRCFFSVDLKIDEDEKIVPPRVYGNMIGAGLSDNEEDDDDELDDDDEDEVLDIHNDYELDNYGNTNVNGNADLDNVENFNPESNGEVSFPYSLLFKY